MIQSNVKNRCSHEKNLLLKIAKNIKIFLNAFWSSVHHFLHIISPIKYNLQTLLNSYNNTLTAIIPNTSDLKVYKRHFFSAQKQVRLAQFITFFQATKCSFLFIFSDLSINIRLINFDYNYLSGFPNEIRVVFAGTVVFGGYMIEQMYFCPVQAQALLQLVRSLVLKKDKHNYLLKKQTQNLKLNVRKGTIEQITRITAFIVYAFQFFSVVGGKFDHIFSLFKNYSNFVIFQPRLSYNSRLNFGKLFSPIKTSTFFPLHLDFCSH